MMNDLSNWILCSEKLPEYDCNCLITVETPFAPYHDARQQLVRVVVACCYFTNLDEDFPEIDEPGFYYWFDDDSMFHKVSEKNKRLIAWMYYPEPYEDAISNDPQVNAIKSTQPLVQLHNSIPIEWLRNKIIENSGKTEPNSAFMYVLNEWDKERRSADVYSE